MNEQEILKEAERRYLYDADFHARVEKVASVLATKLKEATGIRMSEADQSLAVNAASVAFIMAENEDRLLRRGF